VATKGQVPFWAAVERVCDAAKLSVDPLTDAERHLRAVQQLANSRPPRTGANGIRGGIIRSDTIHLRPRSEPSNPSCVSGAVRVEAVPFPAVGRVVVPFDTIPVLLQVTPESRLRWIRVESVRVTKAVDDAGQTLTPQTVADAAALPTQVTRVRGGAIAVNARGGVNLVPGQPMTANRITLNRPTQAIARLKVGENPSKQLRELTGVIRGEVRSAPEEIAALTGLGDKPTETESHGVGLKVSGITKSGDDYTMDVTMNYDPSAVQPANSGSAGMTETVLIQNGGRVIVRRQAAVVIVNGRRLNPTRSRAAMLYGLSVADADGKAFNLRLTRHSIVVNPNGHIAHKMTFLAQPSATGQGKPAKLSFHGTRTKHVEVPFKLTDVPAAAGTGPK
jgi:hypothetical protein